MMSNVKKLFIFLFSLVFGVIFAMAVSLAVAYFSDHAVAASAPPESSSIEADGVEHIQLTVELGKVRVVPGDDKEITIEYQYPPEGFLDNQLRIVSDRDGSDLSIRISSKQKMYFFGLIKDKACDITVSIPRDLLPALSIKMQAGTLTIDNPELKSLDIDGDIAEISILKLGTAALEEVTVNNNIGNITAYLDNFSGQTVKDFTASVNIGTVELHLRLDEKRGYRLDYAYNIGSFERKEERSFGVGKSASYETEEEQSALYQIKTDIGGIRVYEDRGAA